jgi:hypothetical protein
VQQSRYSKGFKRTSLPFDENSQLDDETILTFLGSNFVSLLSILLVKTIGPSSSPVSSASQEQPWLDARAKSTLDFDHYAQPQGIQRILTLVLEGMQGNTPGIEVAQAQQLCAHAAVSHVGAPYFSLLTDIAGHKALANCLQASDIVFWPGQSPTGALQNTAPALKTSLQPFYAFDVNFLTEPLWFAQQAMYFSSELDRQRLVEAAKHGDWVAQYAIVDCAHRFGLKIEARLPSMESLGTAQLNHATRRAATSLLYNHGGNWGDLAPSKPFYQIVLPGLTGLPFALDPDNMPTKFPKELTSYYPTLVALQQREDRRGALEKVVEPWPRDLHLAYLAADGGDWKQATDQCLEAHLDLQIGAAESVCGGI